MGGNCWTLAITSYAPKCIHVVLVLSPGSREVFSVPAADNLAGFP